MLFRSPKRRKGREEVEEERLLATHPSPSSDHLAPGAAEGGHVPDAQSHRGHKISSLREEAELLRCSSP